MNASRKRMSDSTLLFTLPQEILVEILAKLPAKSLVRFRCVSKFFRSLIADPRFADLHRRWSLTLPGSMSILIAFRPKAILPIHPLNKMPRVHYNMSYSKENQGKIQAKRVRHLDVKGFRKGYLGASVNGLISLCTVKGDVAICNLSTRQRVFLPKSSARTSPRIEETVLIGFDSVSKRYKVLKLEMWGEGRNPKTLTPWVFTLGVDKSWRKIDCSSISSITSVMEAFFNTNIHINGVIYSVHSFGTDGSAARYSLVAFDVGVENFGMIYFPDELSARYRNLHDVLFRNALVDLDGRLANIHLIKEDLTCNMEIWTWEKAKEWEKSIIPIPSEESQVIRKADSLRFTSNHVGEIVILAIKNRESASILFCNVRRQVWRTFDICGLRDDLIKGCYVINAFIHISVDNLFSLE